MGIRRIRFYHYRNLIDSEILLDAPEVYLIGDNGQGKTNFIESVYLVSYGTSFRTKRTEGLIKEGEEEAVVQATFGEEKVQESSRTVTVRLHREQKKDIRVDSHPVTDRKDLIEFRPCILFGHGYMEFIIGSPEMRRRFFNQTISLMNPLFIDLLRQYRHILRARNLVLRSGKPSLLDVYDGQLIQRGVEIRRTRERVLEEFNAHFIPLYRKISGLDGDVDILYQSSWKGSDIDIQQHIFRLREKERVMGTTVSGPHRDRIDFRIRKKPFVGTASTGQVRLLALAIRVCQARYCAEKTGKKPVLLLDDVLLELDERRKEAFLRELPEYDQIFFTFLPNENYLHYARSDTRMFMVQRGCLEPWKPLERS